MDDIQKTQHDDSVNMALILGKIDTRLTVIEIGVGDLKKTVSGNGKPGLVDCLRILETKVDNHLSEAEKVSERKEKIGGRQWAVWLLIISNVVALCFQLVRTGYIK
jgi:hypothetical protein